MTQFGRIFIALLVLLSRADVVCGEQTDETPKKTNEFLSPDGQFAFRYTGASEDEKQAYELFEKASGKVVKTVAESDPDLGPSARFQMEVLWRPDAKAFALTALLWKRGTSLSVFVRDSSTLREIKLPELSIEIPEKAKKGKNFPHVVELDSLRRSFHHSQALPAAIRKTKAKTKATTASKSEIRPAPETHRKLDRLKRSSCGSDAVSFHDERR
jgi:hypothetical protein